jgi:glutamine synthetase
MHFLAPHHNSMRLLKSGHLSYPTYQSWSLNHVSSPLKAILALKQQINKPPSASISHLELPHFDHTANLSLALALVTICGMDGLKRAVKLPQPLDTDPDRMEEQMRKQRHIRLLPQTFEERKTLMVSGGDIGKPIREMLGLSGLQKYIMIQESEVKKFTDMTFEEEVKLIINLY